MKKLLKVLNPFIWLLNFFSYMSHMDIQANNDKYEPYDFDNDIKYF